MTSTTTPHSTPDATPHATLRTAPHATVPHTAAPASAPGPHVPSHTAEANTRERRLRQKVLRQERRDTERALALVFQQLRVIQTGVQILAAFLLTLPFTTRFSSTTGFQKGLYVFTLSAAAVTTALMIAPVSYHRRFWHRHDGKPRDVTDVVRIGALLAEIGMGTLLLAAVGGVMLAVDIALGRAWSTCLAGALVAVYGGLWYALPSMRNGGLLSRLRRERRAAGRARSGAGTSNP